MVRVVISEFRDLKNSNRNWI